MNPTTSFILMVLHVLLKISDGFGEKIVINTDAGSDDAIAILMLLRYEMSEPKSRPIEIIGITCTYGNTLEEQVETNILRTLTVADRTDIPVYFGAKHGFVEPFHTDNYWGSDGFGDVNWDYNITDDQIDRSKHAAVALADMARENAGDISIISLGPLTNIALAISLDEKFVSNIRNLYQMGGIVDNSRDDVEFNFAADPESNFVIFNPNSTSQIVLFPQDAYLAAPISKKWRKNYLGRFPSPYIEFINRIESVALAKNSTKWESPDLMAVACFIEPSLVTSHSQANLIAETQGSRRGLVKVDNHVTANKTKNVDIIYTIDVQMFKALAVRYLTCAEISC